RNDKGQFIPKELPGTEQVRPVQLVLLAMGFLGPEQPLLDALKVERDARTNIKADFEKYSTSIKGVFAAGACCRPRQDIKGVCEKFSTRIKGVCAPGYCRRGKSVVVGAFNEGRGAARECDR